jgi:dipeptidyl aminopeptidase/acylaminoacyl peptidase
MLRPSRRPPLLLLAAVGLAAGLLAAGLLSVPRVAGVKPPEGTTGAPALPSLSITFNRPMRADTVEGRFHLEPERSGTFLWSDREMTFTPSQPWPEGEQVTVTLDAGALSTAGLPTFGATHWSFRIGAGRLAYLWPANEVAGLYVWSADSGEPQSLFQAPAGVTDFSLTHDGASIIYSVSTDEGTEIREFPLSGGDDRRLHLCGGPSTCRAASLSPDRSLLVYLQEEPQPDRTVLRRVWVKPMPDGEAYTVAAGDHATSQPLWSSQAWLVIYDHALRGYALYDKVAPDQARLAFMVPNELGEVPAWSPDGSNLLFAEILFLPEATQTAEENPPRYYSHLKRVSIADGREEDLSGEEAFLVEDSGPSYSPDGAWIAFSRRSLVPSQWTLGRQVWIMRADGSEPVALTARPALNHAALVWSPDGSRLAYMLFDQARASEPSDLWWMWADGRDGGLIATAGYAPEWIP